MSCHKRRTDYTFVICNFYLINEIFCLFAGQDMVPKPPLQVQEAGQGESNVRKFSKQSGKNLVLRDVLVHFRKFW